MDNGKFNELRSNGVFKQNRQTGMASVHTNERRTERQPKLRLPGDADYVIGKKRFKK